MKHRDKIEGSHFLSKYLISEKFEGSPRNLQHKTLKGIHYLRENANNKMLA